MRYIFTRGFEVGTYGSKKPRGRAKKSLRHGHGGKCVPIRIETPHHTLIIACSKYRGCSCVTDDGVKYSSHCALHGNGATAKGKKEKPKN